MRYPLWAFFFVLVMPIFTAHALLSGKVEVLSSTNGVVAQSPANNSSYWTYEVASR